MSRYLVDFPHDVLKHACTILPGGRQVSPRGIPTREILNVGYVVEYPDYAPVDIPERKLSAGIAALEVCSLVGQTSVPELAMLYPKLFATTNAGVFDGAYGIRVHGMLSRIVEKLRSDPESRQAVLTLFGAREDLHKVSRDIPCTLSLQFLIRDQKLHLVANMRSNDGWLGLPYDLIMFAGLQVAIAQSLGIGVGRYYHNVGSFHIYESDIPRAVELAESSVWYDVIPLQIEWGESDIGDISSRARSILMGIPISAPTEWEEWCDKSCRK